MRHGEETSMCCYIENCHADSSRKPSPSRREATASARPLEVWDMQTSAILIRTELSLSVMLRSINARWF
jgi:hypothetical protein